MFLTRVGRDLQAEIRNERHRDCELVEHVIYRRRRLEVTNKDARRKEKMRNYVIENLRTTLQPQRNPETVCRLEDLSHDLKRMLRMQWKEFGHYIDDHGFEGFSRDINMRRRAA